VKFSLKLAIKTAAFCKEHRIKRLREDTQSPPSVNPMTAKATFNKKIRDSNSSSMLDSIARDSINIA
jgi:hypothetical protein